MSGKGQLFLHRKNAHADSMSFFGNRIFGKDESGLGEIHLASKILHVLRAKAASIEKNRQRVASESSVGKYIDLYHGEFL